MISSKGFRKTISTVAVIGLMATLSPNAYAGDDDKDSSLKDKDMLITILMGELTLLKARVAKLEATNLKITKIKAPNLTPTTIMANGVALGALVSITVNTVANIYNGITATGVSFSINTMGTYMNPQFKVGFVTPDCTGEVYFMPSKPLPMGAKLRFEDIASHEYESLGSGTYTFTSSEYDAVGNCVQTTPTVMSNAQRASRITTTPVIPPVSIL